MINSDAEMLLKLYLIRDRLDLLVIDRGPMGESRPNSQSVKQLTEVIDYLKSKQ